MSEKKLTFEKRIERMQQAVGRLQSVAESILDVCSLIEEEAEAMQEVAERFAAKKAARERPVGK